jgi:ADP-ribose pyrophosphatase
VLECWFARGLEAGERQLDVGEFLDVFSLAIDDVDEAARRGEITDAKTLVGLLWLANWRAGRWPLHWVTVPAPP